MQTVEYDPSAADEYDVVVSASVGHAKVDVEAWQLTRDVAPHAPVGSGGGVHADKGAGSTAGGDAASTEGGAPLTKNQQKKLARKEWRRQRKLKRLAEAAARKAADGQGESAGADTSTSNAGAGAAEQGK